jgi:hypothetical protein
VPAGAGTCSISAISERVREGIGAFPPLPVFRERAG